MFATFIPSTTVHVPSGRWLSLIDAANMSVILHLLSCQTFTLSDKDYSPCLEWYSNTYKTSASVLCCLTVYLYEMPAVRTSDTASPGCTSMVAPDWVLLILEDPCWTTCIVAGCAVQLTSSKSTSYGKVQVGDMAATTWALDRNSWNTSSSTFSIMNYSSGKHMIVQTSQWKCFLAPGRLAYTARRLLFPKVVS